MNKDYIIRHLAIVLILLILLFGFSKALLFIGFLKVILMIGASFVCGYLVGKYHKHE